MDDTLHLTVNWQSDIEMYEVEYDGESLYSNDGDIWATEDGRLAGGAFNEETIVLVGGPRDGEAVS